MDFFKLSFYKCIEIIPDVELVINHLKTEQKTTGDCKYKWF